MEERKYLLKQIVKNKVQLIAITTLIASVAILFNCLYLGVIYVQENYNYMIKQSNQSSLAFLPELALTDQQMREIMEIYHIPLDSGGDDPATLFQTYDVNLEPYYDEQMDVLKNDYEFIYTKFTYKVLAEKKKTYFLTAYNEVINPIIGPREVPKNQTVALTTQKDLPEKLSLAGETYDVTDSFSSLDFIQLYDLEYSSNNLTTNNIGVWLNETDYNQVDAREKMYYLIQFEQSDAAKRFEKEQLAKADYYLETKDYLKNFEETIRMNYRLALLPLIIYVAITLIIFYITFRNLLDSMDKDFGLLKIIGVKKYKIILAMTGIYSLLAFIGLFIGHLIGRASLMLMRNQFMPLFNFIYAIRVPFFKNYLFFYGLCLLAISILVSGLVSLKVRNRTLTLLKSESLAKSSFLLRLSKPLTKKITFFYALKTSFGLKKISRLIIIILGVFLTTSFLALGIGLFSEQLTQVQQLNQSANYEKMYFFDQDVRWENKNVAYLTEAKLKKDDRLQSIQLIGLDPKGDIYDKKIYTHLAKDTVVLSKTIAQRNNLQKNDQLKLTVDGVELSLTVAHILDSNYESRSFVTLATLYQEAIPAKQFNLFYQKKNATKPADLPKAARSENVSTFKENNLNNFSQILMIVGVLLVFSVLIVVLVFALISSLSVHDNLADMKVMRLLGYRSLAIFRATTTTYLLTIVLVFCIGMAVFPALCQIFEQLLNVGNWQFYLGINARITTYLISASIVILNYYLWMFLVFRKGAPKKIN